MSQENVEAVRDGKVAEVREFRSWPDALEAAGLSE